MGKISRVRIEGDAWAPFSRERLARSLRRAVETSGVGDVDMADELTGVALLFLEKRFSDDNPPAIDDIRHLVHRVLIETGHVRVAAAYRKSSGALEFPGTAGAGLPPSRSLEVIDSELGLRTRFDRDRLIASIASEACVNDLVASEIADGVVARLRDMEVETVSTMQLREVLDLVLLERGDREVAERCRLIGVAASRIEEWVHATGRGAPDPEVEAAAAVLSRWSLDAIHSPCVRDAHAEGRIHVMGLSTPLRVEEARIDARGPLFASVKRPEDFLLELVSLIHSLRPLVRSGVVVRRFAEGVAHVTAGVSLRRMRTFVDRLLDQLLRDDVCGRPLLPALTLEVHLGGEHLEDAGADDEARRVRLLADLLLDRLERRSALRGRLGVTFLLRARAPHQWPESETLSRLFRAARRHPGVAFRLLRDADEARLGGSDEAPEQVVLDVGAAALNLPYALASAEVQSLDDVASAISGAMALSLDALSERFWFLRGAAPETLRGVIARLPGGRELRIASEGQGGTIRLWGLLQSARYLRAKGIIEPGEEPEVLTRIFSCLDYLAGEPRDEARLRIRLGGLRERRLRERFFHVTDGLAARRADRELMRALEADDDGLATLPLVSPLHADGNRRFLEAGFLRRLGPGLALPARGDDELATGAWLTRLFENTALNYFELESGAELIEVQEPLFRDET